LPSSEWSYVPRNTRGALHHDRHLPRCPTLPHSAPLVNHFPPPAPHRSPHGIVASPTTSHHHDEWQPVFIGYSGAERARHENTEPRGRRRSCDGNGSVDPRWERRRRGHRRERAIVRAASACGAAGVSLGRGRRSRRLGRRDNGLRTRCRHGGCARRTSPGSGVARHVAAGGGARPGTGAWAAAASGR